MPNFPFKKILAVLIVILVGGAAVFWASKILQRQKTTKCLADTAKMTDEQIVEKINNLTVSQEELGAINRKAVSYLFCNFLNSDKSEEIYQKTRALIQKLRLLPGTAEGTIEILTDMQANSLSDAAFPDLISVLAVGDFDEICPDELPAIYAEVAARFSRKYNIVDDINYQKKFLAAGEEKCNLLFQYSENKDKLEKEIFNFKEWDKNSSTARHAQYDSKILTAYRFGGEEATLKVCNNIANTNYKEECISRANTLGSYIEEGIKRNETRGEEIKRQCASQHKELENLICSVSK